MLDQNTRMLTNILIETLSRLNRDFQTAVYRGEKEVFLQSQRGQFQCM